jgi:hypothetical protein
MPLTLREIAEELPAREGRDPDCGQACRGCTGGENWLFHVRFGRRNGEALQLRRLDTIRFCRGAPQ